MQNPSPTRANPAAEFKAWALIPLALIVAAVAAPYALTHDYPMLAFTLNRGFALICHQQPERSFFVFGAAVAVCVRCLGIYIGAAIGLLGRASHRIALRIFIAAIAINAIDAAVEFSGLHGNWDGLRFVLGLSLGLAGGLLISSSMPCPTPVRTEP
jgi:uncharacterized membrane protein